MMVGLYISTLPQTDIIIERLLKEVFADNFYTYAYSFYRIFNPIF